MVFNYCDIYIFGVVNRIFNNVYIVDLKIYYLVYIFLKIYVYYINVWNLIFDWYLKWVVI